MESLNTVSNENDYRFVGSLADGTIKGDNVIKLNLIGRIFQENPNAAEHFQQIYGIIQKS